MKALVSFASQSHRFRGPHDFQETDDSRALIVDR